MLRVKAPEFQLGSRSGRARTEGSDGRGSSICSWWWDDLFDFWEDFEDLEDLEEEDDELDDFDL